MVTGGEPWFFVVRTWHGVEHFALEFGDHPTTRDELQHKTNPRPQRFQLPPEYRPTLDEAVAAWKRGVRIKPPPAPPKVEEPKTFNSIRRRKSTP